MNILIAGLGSIGRKHLSALKTAAPEACVYALRSSGSSPTVDGVSNIMSVGELDGVHIDFCILSTPTAIHLDTFRQLLALKCPILVEKPLSHLLSEASEMTRLADESGVTTYVGCNLRFLGCLRYVREHLHRPGHRINEVNAYCGSYLPEWRPGCDFRKVYSANTNLGGGVHIDLIHEIDYICWMFGLPATYSRTIRSSSSLEIDAPDYACYCLDYPGFCASVILNYYRRDPRRTLEIVWDDDTWLIDLISNTVSSALSGNTLYESPLGIADTMAEQMKYMIELAQTGNKSTNSCSDALEILKICLDK